MRVRFAPSPTGYLHIGGARTALFNYLFARQHGGTLVLRIEDTDLERSTPEATRAIFDGLRYLGLEWDEGPEAGGEHGPYFQSQRGDRHAAVVNELLAEGRAYYCFCGKDRLEELRVRLHAGELAVAQFTQEVRACADLDRAEVDRRRVSGEAATVRFRVPEGTTVFDDMVRGSVEVKNRDVEDFVIARADGTPVYNLAVVADDRDMRITHVIRGEDHLTNTTKQVLLFEALESAVPRFAHISLILAPGGGKLSKRHGAVSVTEYRERGYLPEAMINFLARLGWSYDDKQEIFALDELVEKFSFDGVSKSGAVYDLQKLDHLGGHWMRQRPLGEVVDLAVPYLVDAGWVTRADVAPGTSGRVKIERIVALEQERISHLLQIVEKARFYFEEPTEPDKGARKALRKGKEAADLVRRFAQRLDESIANAEWGPCEHARLEEHARAFIAEQGVALGDLAQPVRALVTGRGATPGLFEVLAILGKETCLRRLARVDEWIAIAAG